MRVWLCFDSWLLNYLISGLILFQASSALIHWLGFFHHHFSLVAGPRLFAVSTWRGLCQSSCESWILIFYFAFARTMAVEEPRKTVGNRVDSGRLWEYFFLVSFFNFRSFIFYLSLFFRCRSEIEDIQATGHTQQLNILSQMPNYGKHPRDKVISVWSDTDYSFSSIYAYRSHDGYWFHLPLIWSCNDCLTLVEWKEKRRNWAYYCCLLLLLSIFLQY